MNPDETMPAARNEAVLRFMEARRSASAKALGGEAPPEADVARMIAIASRVPDHGKLAPWRFVRYSPAAAARIGEAIAGRALALNPAISAEQIAAERATLTRSPLVIGLVSAAAEHPKIPVWEQQLSAGAAGMNLLIAANALGYDAQWVTGWAAYDEAIAPLLGAQPGERMAGLFHIGRPTLPKTSRDRPETGRVFSTV
jgi:nitroreductase